MPDKSIREKKITRTGIIGIVANIFLAALKAAAGLMSGSIAIALDAINNLSDALSSVITIVGVKLAGRKPDREHPFGHGRIEYFSAMIIALIILGAGLGSLIEAVKKTAEPSLPSYSLWQLGIVSAAIVVKILLSRYFKTQGAKYNSDALTASGADAGLDALLSAATLIGAAITMLFSVNPDGIIGILISVFIIKAGAELLLEPASSALGSRPDSELSKSIKRIVESIPGVIGAYDLVLHNYGPNYAIGAVHIEIDGDMLAADIHKLTQEIRNSVFEQFGIIMTVGIYALDGVHAEYRSRIIEAVKAHSGVVDVHGVFFEDYKKYLSFDVSVDFTVKDSAALREEIIQEVRAIAPGYEIRLNFDICYSS